MGAGSGPGLGDVLQAVDGFWYGVHGAKLKLLCRCCYTPGRRTGCFWAEQNESYGESIMGSGTTRLGICQIEVDAKTTLKSG